MKNIKTLHKAGYAAAIILTVIGVYACLSRYVLPTSTHIWLSNILYGPEYTQKALPALASKPGIEIVHRLLGAIYLIIGLLQFSPRFRKQRPRLHKTLGKIFMVFSITAAVSGMLFAVLVPFAGFLEVFPIFTFAFFMLYATYRAYVHIRRGEVMAHREWIARSYAVGLGIATIRVMVLVINYLTAFKLDQPQVVMVSLWGGWVLTLGAVEVYNQMLHAEQQKKLRAKAVV
ncbi:MAG TPA: hypothetical protein DCS93_13830 [Microscillaceae bacterium]|nr:hypothetical protein [Microscillaceae bacterium]